MEKISRNPRKGKFLGVCYGLGKAYDVEPLWIRLGLIIFAFWMPFLAIVAYVVAALIIPEESEVLPSVPGVGDPTKNTTTKVEKGLKQFFDMLYKFGEKVVNALK